MNSLPSNEFLDPIFEKDDLIEGFKVCYKQLFLSFEISEIFYKILRRRLYTR